MEVERSIQNIELDYSQLLTLVRKAFPDCQRLDDWKILSGGALNTTYKIQMGKEPIVLRLYARDRLHCKTEKEIHRFIDGRVSTPKLLYADESFQPWPYSIFVNIVQLMDTPPERPNLFHQLKNAIQNTINHWESAPDLYQLAKIIPRMYESI